MAVDQLDILLVRHADPVRAGTPGYATEDRPLSDIGVSQAEELVHRLGAEPLVAIYSSP